MLGLAETDPTRRSLELAGTFTCRASAGADYDAQRVSHVELRFAAVTIGDVPQLAPGRYRVADLAARARENGNVTLGAQPLLFRVAVRELRIFAPAADLVFSEAAELKDAELAPPISATV